MKILFLAPQPFYQERGTTIAIDLLLQVLSERGDSVDVLTFHVGEDRKYPNVSLKRIAPFFAPKAVRPGFSLRKTWCDVFLLRDSIRMMRNERYDLVYAVEDAGFIAALLQKLFKVPFVFDMDSSMTTQMIDRFPWLGVLDGPMRRIEAWPMRKAIAVVPMCEDLAKTARRHNDKIVSVLSDVSLVAGSCEHEAENLREVHNIRSPILMYVGNLEEYQGIDLLLDCMAYLKSAGDDAVAVIIGGTPKDIAHYKKVAEEKKLTDHALFVGPRPIAQLGAYLAQGTILMSPRIHGTNTPMKVYSYLDSGVPVVATELPTHTQVMSKNEAALVEPNAADMANTVSALLKNPEERKRLATNARDLIARKHSLVSFRRSANNIFDEIARDIDDEPPIAVND